MNSLQRGTDSAQQPAKIFLLNGPMNCGKTTLINHLRSRYEDINFVDFSCKQVLIPLVQTFFRVNDEEFRAVYENRSLKELPTELFQITPEYLPRLREVLPEMDLSADSRWARKGGDAVINLSVREAMIFFSEVIYKPVFGKGIFGEVRAKNLNSSRQSLTIPFEEDRITVYYDDSAAFVEELTALSDSQQYDALVLRVSTDRSKFSGKDSRGYLPSTMGNICTKDVGNFITDTEEEFLATAEGIFIRWLYCVRGI